MSLRQMGDDEMLERNKKRVRSLIKQIQETESLALKFHLFEEYILENNLTENDYLCFGKRYKNLYLSWGIYRCYFSKNKREITNSENGYEGYLWNIYVNTLDLYNSHKKYGLNDLRKHVFYLDDINSTFYCTDEQIENFLNELNSWYLSALEECKASIKQEKIKKLENELAMLKVGEK